MTIVTVYPIIKYMTGVEYTYNAEKNIKLKEERNISFDEIIYYIGSGHLLDTIKNPNKTKYGDQSFYVIDVDGYVYLVPFVKNGNLIFLKTIFPSRKHTKRYLQELTERKKQRGEIHESKKKRPREP